MSDTKSNVAVLQQAFDHLNAGDIDGCLSLMRPDFIINIAEMPYQKRGHKAWKQHSQVLFDSFPDAQVHVEDIIAEDDKVAVRVRITGTHKGEFLSSRPTGKRIEYTSHEVYRFEDGKIAEEWICSDNITLMTQVGALSSTRLVSMWLSGSRFWFGLASGTVMAAALQHFMRWYRSAP